MNLYGLAIGAIMILAIGLGHIIVIKWAYYWGTKSWAGMGLLGTGLIVASLFTKNMLFSAGLGMFGATFIWGVFELLKLKKRGEQELSPDNTGRQSASEN